MAISDHIVRTIRTLPGLASVAVYALFPVVPVNRNARFADESIAG
jgi:hypothetical protein